MTPEQRLIHTAFTDAMDTSIMGVLFKDNISEFAIYMTEMAVCPNLDIPVSSISIQNGMMKIPSTNSYTLVDISYGKYERLTEHECKQLLSMVFDLLIRGRYMMRVQHDIAWDTIGSISAGLITGLMRILVARQIGCYVDALPKEMDFCVSTDATSHKNVWDVTYSTKNSTQGVFTFPVAPE